MSIALSVLLIAGALVAFGFTLHKIRKSEASVGDSLFWFVFALVLVVLALFPDVAMQCAYELGFISAANFIFLCVMAVLIVKMFFMTFEIARLRARLASLTQELGIDKLEQRQARGEKQRSNRVISSEASEVSAVEESPRENGDPSTSRSAAQPAPLRMTEGASQSAAQPVSPRMAEGASQSAAQPVSPRMAEGTGEPAVSSPGIPEED